MLLIRKQITFLFVIIIICNNSLNFVFENSFMIILSILSMFSERYDNDNVISLVEDKSARVGDACSVSSICLQQEQGQLSSNYLQCDQT